MYIKQSELFTGTSMDFVKKFMDICETSSHQKGEILFRENDPAKFFFILLNGCVKLSVGVPEQVVYKAKLNGEAFGWSSLIGGDVYSASAECLEASKLLKTDRDKLSRMLEEDAENGIIFFKQLAATLGKRLLQTYKMLESSKGDSK
ncbi:MAG: cyclic nucleotide-binding domain-containing protein [Desulfobacterales bacterium]|nr:cyclic nucleotide-binding domain-containing protein [Desulfobacterales bacterium]